MDDDLITFETFGDKADIESGITEVYQKWAELFDMVEQRSGQSFQEAAQGIKLFTNARQVDNQVLKQSLELNEEEARRTHELSESKKALRDQIIAQTSVLGNLKVATKESIALAQESMAQDVAAGKEYSEQTKLYIADANARVSQLKSINEAVGNYRDSVGNYSNAVHDALAKSAKDYRGLYTSLRSLRGVSYLLGDALGVSVQKVNAFRLAIEHAAQGMAFFKQRQADAAKATEEVKEATKEESVVQEVNNTVKEQSIVESEKKIISNQAESASNAEVGESLLSSSGIIGLVIGVTATLIAGIYEYIKAKKLSKEADEAEKAEWKEEIELKKAILKVDQEIAVLEGTKTKTEVTDEDAALKSAELMMLANNKRKTLLAQLDAENPDTKNAPERDKIHTEADYQDKLMLHKKYLDKKAAIEKNYNHDIGIANDYFNKTWYENYLKLTDAQKKEAIKSAREIEEAKDDAMGKGEKRDLAKLETKHKYDLMEADLEFKGVKNAEELANKKKTIEEVYQYEREAILTNAENKAEKISDKLENHEEENIQKREEAIEKSFNAEIDALDKKYKTMQALSDKFYAGLYGEEDKNIIGKDKAQLESDELDKPNDDFTDKNGKPLSRKEIKKKLAGIQQNASDIYGDKVAIARDELGDSGTKAADNDKKLQDRYKEIDQIDPLANKKKGQEYDEKGNPIQSVIDQNKEIQRQTDDWNGKRLSAQAEFYSSEELRKMEHDNAMEKAEKEYQDEIDKSKKKAAEEQKKREAKEAKESLSLLDKALKKYNENIQKNLQTRNEILQTDKDAQEAQNNAGKSNNLDTVMKQQAANLATMQAQQRTAANEYDYISILSQVLTGIPKFAEGTENTGKGGNIDSMGGFLAINHPEERIFSAEDNAKLGGVSNKTLVDTWERNMFLPKLNLDDVSQPKQYRDAQLSEIVSKLDALVNKKEVEYVYETEREAVRIVTENGVRRTIRTSKATQPPYRKHPSA